MADFFIHHKGHYPALEEAALPRFNLQGLAAYAAGSLAALVVPGIPPANGIVTAFLLYAFLDLLHMNRSNLSRETLQIGQNSGGSFRAQR